MRVGLIADVHGDYKGLRLALDILRGKGADVIVCAGDLVEKGPHGMQVVQHMRQQGIACVLGNHDEMAVDNQSWLRENADLTHSYVQTQLLDEESVQYLAGLPPTLRYEWAGMRVLVAHGSPRSNVEYIFEYSPAAKYRGIAAEVAADVVVLGHTHEPMHVCMGGVHFLNPGSVYVQGSRTCALVTLPECSYRVYDLGTGMEVAVSMRRG